MHLKWQLEEIQIVLRMLCIIATEDVNTPQRKPNNWWKKTDFAKACHAPELPAIINPLKVFGKPWNVRWMTLATSHFKKQQEPLLSILSFITIPNDCIQVSIMPFQTIFSLFYLSTNLDKFRFQDAGRQRFSYTLATTFFPIDSGWYRCYNTYNSFGAGCDSPPAV